MSRRAIRSKTPTKIQNVSIDLDKQDANLRSMQSDTLTWNVLNESVPRFGRNSRFDNKVFNVIQMSNIGTILISSNTLPQFAGLYFTASAHLPQFSTFQSVFDQYKIAEIEVWLQPTSSSTSLLGAGTTNFVSVVDYDDAITPTSLNSLYQYENVIVGNSSNGHYRKFQPHLAVAAYSGTFTSYKNERADWLDVAYGSVNHFGIKVGMDPTTSTGDIKVNAYVRMWCQFRNVF